MFSNEILYWLCLKHMTMSSEKITIHPHGSLIQRNNCVHETMFAKVEHMKITYTMIHKIKERIVITYSTLRYIFSITTIQNYIFHFFTISDCVEIIY